MNQSMNLLAVAGLVYDIVGAILLAEAIVGTRDEILVNQARHRGQFSTGNLSLFAALEEQRHDARLGLAFLVIGFFLQLFANLGYILPLGWLWGLVFAAFIAAGIAYWQV